MERFLVPTEIKEVIQMSILHEIGKKGLSAKAILHKLSTLDKNKILNQVAIDLVNHKDYILHNNSIDIREGRKNGLSDALLDRLLLTEDRIVNMANGLKQIAQLEDPIGQVISMSQRPNGLKIGKQRVPLGMVGIIYESRPNVTVDAFGLCFKTNNVVLLRGGKEAINSNVALVNRIQDSLEAAQLPREIIQIVEDTSRETALEMMRMNDYLDVLIPRGGAGLIRSVIENSTLPVIETGKGNCHIYVDQTADLEMALNIIDNAKTSRPGVCNACEKVLIHQSMVPDFVGPLIERLKSKSVEIRGDEHICQFDASILSASEKDWETEYLDKIIGIKVVQDISDAISHINHFGTGHSEAIMTQDHSHAMRFLDEIDAAAVYINASTRFTDGEEFGYGAEIGISTQKLHARGPMGLEALTSIKHIIFGNGQIR